MMSKLFIGKLAALFFTCLLSVNAHAQSKVVWSCNAMAAVPAISAVRNQLYEVRAGRVIFKEGKSGTINLFCPITRDLGPSLRSLHLTYRDGDGHKGKTSSVTAAIRRVNKKTGHVTSFKFGTVSSNDVAAPDSGPKGWKTHQSARASETLLNQNHHMDLGNFYYYVQITMRRTDDKVPLAVMGVYLTT
jgi:hypothetical protein